MNKRAKKLQVLIRNCASQKSSFAGVLIGILFFLLCLTNSAYSQVNLLRDPSFEQMQIAANSTVKDPIGTGWTFSGHAGLVNGTLNGSNVLTHLSAPHGKQFAYLEVHRSSQITNDDGIIRQSVNFPASGNYTLQMQAALRQSIADAYEGTWATYFLVEIDGNFVCGLQHATSYLQFTPVSMTFYATAGIHTLSLIAGGPTLYCDTATFIDNLELVTSNSGPLSTVTLTSVPQSMATGKISEPFTLQLTDGAGLPVDAPAVGVVLNLASTSRGGQFLDASGSAINSVTVATGASTAIFYYQDSIAGSPQLTVSASGLASATQVEWVVDAAQISFAHQDPSSVVPSSIPNPDTLPSPNILAGNGQPLHLSGVNLGGWLIMEPYFTPVDAGVPGNSYAIQDQFSAIEALDSRFGVQTEQQLFRTYQSTWITETDIQNVHNQGLNVIRVPFWWANLYTTDLKWRPDAFEYLDWVVAEAAKYNIYVILDLHGVFGGESLDWADSGQGNSDRIWEPQDPMNKNYYFQSKTMELWQRVATHFKYNNTVLAYDLINEPVPMQGDSNGNAEDLAIENLLYNTVRKVDPGHMLMMELTGATWGWNGLKSPASQGWTNVCYSTHSYATSFDLPSAENEYFNLQVNRANRTKYNVPDVIGETTWHGSEQEWLGALTAWNKANISWIFWTLKGTTPDWCLYSGSAGSYDLSPLQGYKPTPPRLEVDSAQSIANEWGSYTTAGTGAPGAVAASGVYQSYQPYPQTVSYPSEFSYNHVIGDPLTIICQPQVATGQGLLPAVASASGVTGANFGFEVPTVTNDEGGDSFDFRLNYYTPQTVSASWTFTGNAGITGTGLQWGVLTGWSTNRTEILAPQGTQSAYLGNGASISQVLTSSQAGQWTITIEAAQRSGQSGAAFSVSLNNTVLSPVTAPSGKSLTPSSSAYGSYTFVSSSLPAGSYPLTFTGTAGGTVLIDDVRITVGTVAAQAPAVDSGGSFTCHLNTPFDYTIAATNSPTSFNATGLPPGLKVNTTTGEISGTPTQVGNYPVTLSATNASGTGTQAMTLMVQIAAPTFSYTDANDPQKVTYTPNSPFSYHFGTGGGTPTSFYAFPLPSGLTATTSGNSGYLSGTITGNATYNDIVLYAANAGGVAEEFLTLSPSGGTKALPVITSALTATATVDAAFSYTIVATNNPTSFNVTGLPTGLIVNQTTGTITGIPTSAGTFDVALSAANSDGTGTATLVLTVTLPSFTGSATATPQNDGVPNLIKYLCDIDPSRPMSSSDISALPQVGLDTTSSPGNSYLTITYRQNSLLNGVTVNVQVSSDLIHWKTVTPDSWLQVDVDPMTGDPIIEDWVNTDGASREFIRLNVTIP